MNKLNHHFNREVRRKRRDEQMFWTIVLLLILEQQRWARKELEFRAKMQHAFAYG